MIAENALIILVVYNFYMASEIILQTKLHRPRLPQRFVHRPHLVEWLNDTTKVSEGVFASRLTVISAPAGYGKTTLLSEWSDQIPLAVNWLSLEAADSDLQRFWAHILAAMRTTVLIKGSAALAELESPTASATQSMLAEWINQIAHLSQPFVLIIDDYHLINNASVHESLAYWLEHCPAQMHLIIASRADPPLPLSRLRGRGQMVELRTNNLRFSLQESAEFLNQAMGLNLTPQHISALEARTEGWIAGLQLAALSLQGRNPQAIAHFIDNFTGSQRFILDYLTDEVLLQQPNDIQTFLLHTCMLYRLTGSLCDAVTGQTNGQEILEQLEMANLFVIRLDDERRWYRYHNLFATILQQRLERSQPDLIPGLNLRASQWCELNSFWTDALSYAIFSGDAGRVASLVARNVLVMMEFNELKTLERWLHSLPEKAFQESAWINIAHAWLLTAIGQIEKVEPLLLQAQAGLKAQNNPSEALNRGILGNLAAVRAYLSGLRGDFNQTIEYGRECLAYFPEDDAWMRTWVNSTLAFALIQTGQYEEGEQKMSEALEISQRTGASHVRVLILNNHAGLQFKNGNLPKAEAIFQEAIQMDQEYTNRTGQHLPIAGYAYTELAGIYCEWNDLEKAKAYIAEGMLISESWGEPQLLTSGNLRLAEIRAAEGDWDGALKAISIAQKVTQDLRINSSWRIASLRSLIYLQAGDLDSARQLAETLALEAGSINYQSSEYMREFLLAWLELAEGRLNTALSRASQLVDKIRKINELHLLIRAQALQAVILDSLGHTDQALDILQNALVTAEPGQFIRSFIYLGEPLAQLLVKATATSIKSNTIQRLLEAFKSERQPRPIISVNTGKKLAEPLSERELQVLRLLAIHLTRVQIAEQLIISENTVRTHVKNIYQKLGVHTRAEAIAQAREFRLLV